MVCIDACSLSKIVPRGTFSTSLGRRSDQSFGVTDAHSVLLNRSVNPSTLLMFSHVARAGALPIKYYLDRLELSLLNCIFHVLML